MAWGLASAGPGSALAAPGWIASPAEPARLAAAAMKRWAGAAEGLFESTTIVPPRPSLLAVNVDDR